MPKFRRHAPEWDEATPDEELVGWAQRGQRDAFGVLFDRYLPRVYGYCYRLLDEREAAEDANSIVFTKALAALPGFRPKTPAGSFRGWLFAIAHNVITDELRAQRVTEPLEAAESVHDPELSPEDLTISALERQTVLDLLTHLSADQREVVALRLSGLTATEIGVAMGRPRNAIDGIHHRALLRLRDLVRAGAGPAATEGRVRS